MALDSQKPLVIRDEIHGDISFEGIPRYVIDHPDFQRLRSIKQLGLAEFVFPCATHTRFQHSMGAGFLAGQYFETMLKAWLTSPLVKDERCGQTNLFILQTKQCFAKVASHGKSIDFWTNVSILSGLLHDVGHGPWSHTFEYLELELDFSNVIHQMPECVQKYFKETLKKENNSLKHEDISVIYIFKILKDLEARKVIENFEPYFLTVATLVNKKMLTGKISGELIQAIDKSLKKEKIVGGIDLHKLIRPIVSGPFDVDRIDYIQRDGRNSGVQIGGIEWRRIVTKVIPCLASHPNHNDEPQDVVLISNIKNQHVLDDFVFSLFQMYAQIYMHPKIVGIEEIARKELTTRVSSKKNPKITFETHRKLTDEKFREMLKDDFKATRIEGVLLRSPGMEFHVGRYPKDTLLEKQLIKNGFRLVELSERPMMKDSMGVFLYSLLRSSNNESPRQCYIRPWSMISQLADQFFSVYYSPRVWVQTSWE